MKKLTLDLKQLTSKDGSYWTFPLKIAVVDQKGNEIVETVKTIDSLETSMVFENIPESHFLSLNRDYSFYGKINYEIPLEGSISQIRK